MPAISDFLQRDPRVKPFMFATGFEGSYPVITGKDGRDVRVDGFRRTGHDQRWREDFELVRHLGLKFLRYGPPYYSTHLGPGRYDWSFADDTFHALEQLRIAPIADLCHFGVPDWLENFQNPDFPKYFAEYAVAFARRFPWIILFTPVNEILIAAMFSAKEGWWNERLKSDRAFVTALKHLVKANTLAEEGILGVNPRAIFIQSEASSFYHPAGPAAADRTYFYNQRRFLSLDLCYGVEVGSTMYEYLADNGLARREYAWFMENSRRVMKACVMGTDYYATSEHMVPAGDAPLYGSGEVFGYYLITREYFNRYKLPVMHTETNNLGDVESVRWLRNMWLNMLKLKEDGVPVLGFTWYGLLDQVDWDSALREDNGRVNPLGLYDLNRKIRPVGKAYAQLVEQWRGVLPMFSRRLDIETPPPRNAAEERRSEDSPSNDRTRHDQPRSSQTAHG